jgi:hypothetical protein
MDPKERLKSALLALRAAQDMLQDIRRRTTDIGQAIGTRWSWHRRKLCQRRGFSSRGFGSSSGSLAMPAATFLTSSFVMSFAAARRPGSLSKQTYATGKRLLSRTMKTCVVGFIECPGCRKAASGHLCYYARKRGKG